MPSYASNTSPVTTGLANNEWVKTPVATGTTGFTLGRIVNRSGAASQPLNVMGNPIPYLPASLEHDDAWRHPDHAYEGNAQRQHHDGSRRSRRRLGLCPLQYRRSPRVPGHPARPRTLPPSGQPSRPHLPEERLRSGAAVSAGLPGQGSLHPRCRHRRVPRCRVILPLCSSGRLRNREPHRRQDLEGGDPRRVAVGELHAALHSSRDESGRGRPDRARGRMADHRRPARRQQFALGTAGRRAGALPAGFGRSAVVDAVARYGS